MRTPEELKDGYRAFRRGTYKHQARLYEELGRGQDPDIMIIACADSRAEPADIFNAAPGQLFVVRNVANLVPPYDQGGGLHGVSAAREFAVTALEVKHILIMGADKRAALENAKGKTVQDAPINAVLDGAIVHWAE